MVHLVAVVLLACAPTAVQSSADELRGHLRSRIANVLGQSSDSVGRIASGKGNGPAPSPSSTASPTASPTATVELATQLNAELASGSAASCTNDGFSNCGLVMRTFDWESNPARPVYPSAYPDSNAHLEVPYLKGIVSTMLSNSETKPQAFGSWGVGVVFDPSSAGSKPKCGYGLDSFADRNVRSGTYDSQADGGASPTKLAWTDGVNGCGACHKYVEGGTLKETLDTDPRCLALQWTNLQNDGFFNPLYTSTTFKPGLGKSFMPSATGVVPWKEILEEQANNQNKFAPNSLRYDYSSYNEIDLDVSNLYEHADAVRAFFIDASQSGNADRIATAMDQCVQYNIEHPQNPTPLLWLNFKPNDGSTYFAHASNCRDVGSSEEGDLLDLIFSAAQQTRKGRNKRYPGFANDIWAMSDDNNAQTVRTCIDVPNGLATEGNYLEIWGCNGTPNQKFSFSKSTGTIQYTADKSMCLTAQPGQANEVVLSKCGSRDDQKWELNGGTPRGVGSIAIRVNGVRYCTRPVGGETWDNSGGRALELTECKLGDAAWNEDPAQLWAFHAQVGTDTTSCAAAGGTCAGTYLGKVTLPTR